MDWISKVSVPSGAHDRLWIGDLTHVTVFQNKLQNSHVKGKKEGQKRIKTVKKRERKGLEKKQEKERG